MFDWIWPIVCIGCGEAGGSPWCPDCSPGTLLRPPFEGFGVEATFSVERYDRAVGRALARAKVHGDRTTGRQLGRLFAHQVAPALRGARPDAIVPAPSTRRSRSHRGFSMAALLARALGRQLRVPVVHALHSSATTRMATLDRERRQQALRGRIRSRRLVPGRVVLVDDVLTTGSTAEACAVELLGGQSDQVILATLCAVPRARKRRSVKRAHV